MGAALTAGCASAAPGATLLSTPPGVRNGHLSTETATEPNSLAEATATRAPLAEVTPGAVLEPPWPTPTATLPPLPVRLPQERLAILSPGPGSQVTSPFTVSGRSGPCNENRVRIRLVGEDGRVITQRVTYLWSPPGHSGVFTTEISFRIQAVAEAARLEVSTEDVRSTRLGHLTTLNLVLLSVGTPLVHPALDGPERLTILSPREGASVSGGTVRVRGAGWMDAEAPLAVQLVDRYGAVLAAAEVGLAAPAVGQLGTFEVDLPYHTPYPQYAWVTVFERTPDGSALVHFSSREIWLLP